MDFDSPQCCTEKRRITEQLLGLEHETIPCD